MNRVGIIKTGIVLLSFIVGYLIPRTGSLDIVNQFYWIIVLIRIIVFAVAGVFLIWLNGKTKKIEIKKPDWNENPLTKFGSATSLQFISILGISTGAGMILKSFMKARIIEKDPTSIIAAAIGLLIGIYISAYIGSRKANTKE